MEEINSEKTYKLIAGSRPEVENEINERSAEWFLDTIRAVHTTLGLVFYAVMKRKTTAVANLYVNNNNIEVDE